MTPVPGSHLTPDDLDAWLAGALAPAAQEHLAHCPACQEQAQTEREIIALLAAMPLLGPAPGFADRVMARVSLPQPAAAASLPSLRHRILASRRSTALAAGVLVLLAGSMAGSIIWTLGHQQTLAALGQWLALQAWQAAWIGVRSIASSFIEQPWFAAFKSFATHPGRVGLAFALATVAYVVGIVALRRLLALPTQQVAHVGT
jgi:anti-sigma factor RsiW